MGRMFQILLLLLAGCPHQRDRGSCSDSSHCKAGYACAHWGRCTDTCNTNAACLPGETCVPSSEQAGEDGVRYCGVICDPKDPKACEGKLDHFGGRTVCREITYTHPKYGGSETNPGPKVTGFFCSDPNNGWGDTGNDPDDQADDSGG